MLSKQSNEDTELLSNRSILTHPNIAYVVAVAEITHTTDMAFWALVVLAIVASSQVAGKSSAYCNDNLPLS